ncbi:ImmA/IrrE family metallo-endopeptidase [Pseudogracilibacillus auburnensis]|uniref:ImmA/IrrE family metallo-endopeptidase n=1 Tax=Pseudogracilibacillus auburnensis TaxID=1494959 RepID=UPI00363D93AF
MIKTFRIDNIICLDSNLSKEKTKEVFSHEVCHCLYHVGNQLDMYKLYRQYQEFKADNATLLRTDFYVKKNKVTKISILGSWCSR